MKTLKLLIAFVVVELMGMTFIYAQLERSTWCFGDSVILKFDTVSPLIIGDSKLIHTEQASSISKKNGDLVFYTGVSAGFPYQGFAFNKQNQIMPNGFNIWLSSGADQGLMILPFINDSNKYYLFSVSMDWNNYPPPKQHLYYSIIDMTLDSGMGDVSLKNQLVNDTLIEGYLNVVKHGNGHDWWVICHSAHQQVINGTFYKTLLTPNGFAGVNSQTIGTQVVYATGGQLVLSATGDKAVFPCSFTGVLDLFSFDRCSGDFYNYIPLGDTTGSLIFDSYFGTSFSPDGSKLYASTSDSLFQFDLNAPDIKASRVFIDCSKKYSQHISFGQHQLAPDGKIYITNPNNPSVYDTLSTYLGVINNPDSTGLACNYVLAGFSLNGHEARGLPNLPFYHLGAWQGSVCDTLTGISDAPSVKNQITLMPNPVNSNTIVKFNNSKHEVCLIQLFDVTAKKVFEATTNENYFQLNCSQFENGFYHVVVIKKSTHDILHAKVVVQR